MMVFDIGTLIRARVVFKGFLFRNFFQVKFYLDTNPPVTVGFLF